MGKRIRSNRIRVKVMGDEEARYADASDVLAYLRSSRQAGYSALVRSIEGEVRSLTHQKTAPLERKRAMSSETSPPPPAKRVKKTKKRRTTTKPLSTRSHARKSAASVPIGRRPAVPR